MPNVDFKDTGGISVSYDERVDWTVIVSIFEKDMKSLPSYSSALTALQSDKTFMKHANTLVGTLEARVRLKPEDCLRLLLSEVVYEQQDLVFDDLKFDRIYKGFEEYLYSDTLEYRCISLLHGFEMEKEKIDLEPNLSIIKIPEEERKVIIKEALRHRGPSSLMYSGSAEYAFECFASSPKIFGELNNSSEHDRPSQVARDMFDRACFVLRLFKTGNMNYSGIRKKATSWEPYGGVSITGRTTLDTPVAVKYVLTSKEVPAFLDIWDLHKKTQNLKGNRTDIALRRLNFAYERARLEDRLIDYLIGLEALLLRKDERQELGYRLALRGATLLGKTPKKRKSTFDELKTAYRERSNIVHGGQLKDSVRIRTRQLRFNDFVVLVEEHLRSAIKEFLVLSQKQSESKIINHLDDTIVSGSNP